MPSKVVAVAPGEIALIDFDRQAVGTDEVAGPTIATVLSPGTELAVAYGTRDSIPLPADLGYSAVFRVEEVGRDASGWAPGDLGVTLGPHASWQRRSADDVLHVPSGLTPRTATFARLMNVPMSAVATSASRPGRRAAVLGLGLIGQLTARVLQASGFNTVAADASEIRRNLLPPSIPAFDTLADESVDFLVECSGTEGGVNAGLRALKPGGELVLSGVPWLRRSDASAFDVLDPVFHKFLTLRSGWEWQLPWRSKQWVPSIDLATLMGQSLTWLADGIVDVSGLATTIAPEDVPDYYLAVKTRTASTLTAIVEWEKQ
ncbi:zinc-binding alcohol dehydrogenase [Microbacterium sp.]|uniref:zinc-dependent alcohol dehydrogenase n=1 Tax=Microbacterium sp. TaxID=51671 RepID=UPI0025E77249|nr:zinc-binding alcohol dehydrogenase [Microbacterium sp.]